MKLSIEQVRQFLEQHYSGQGIGDIESLAGGEWSQAFGFRLQDRKYVVRFGRHVQDYMKDEIASNFSREYLPLPHVVEIGQAFEGYFAISEQAFGEMLDDLGADDMQKTVPSVIQMLGAMHDVDISHTTGYGSWDETGNAPCHSWKEYLLKVECDEVSQKTYGWRDKLIRSPFGDSAFVQGFWRLKELVSACPDERYIIHGDLLNRNVLVKDSQIALVIDWGNSVYGDFLYDLAWISYWSSWYPAMKGIDWETIAETYYLSKGVLIPNFKERLLCYKIHIGLDAQSYNAFTERWDELTQNMERTMQFVKTIIV